MGAPTTIDERVEALLEQMTLEEKLAQISSIWITELVDGDRFDPDAAAETLRHGIGHVTRIGASTGLRPDQQSPTPAGRWPLDSLPEGPVVAAVRRLLEADDATRPTVADALVLLAATLPEDHEPWPAGLTPPAAAAALRTGGRR